jgi:hypothetical protein
MRDFLKAVGALLLLVMGFALLLVSARALLLWFFDGVDSTVAAAISAGAITAVGSVGAVAYGRYRERKSAIEAQLRDAKLPVYTNLIKTLMTMLGQDGTELEDEERSSAAIKQMKELTPELVAWAGDDVLAKWSQFRRVGGDLDPLTALFGFEGILRAIRKDFGHSDTGLKDGDILGLFVNDVADYLDENGEVRHHAGDPTS